MSVFYEQLERDYKIHKETIKIMEEAYQLCQPHFEKIVEKVDLNQYKVLRAFQNNNISDFHLNGSTGYGYGDQGRDSLEKVYANVFRAEKALVRSQIVSGTHAIAIALMGNLKSGDEVVSATGCPYDTLLKVIGVHGEDGSLIQSGVKYKEIPLTKEKGIDINNVCSSISDKTKMVIFQRSKGYAWRPSFSIETLQSAIKAVKNKFPQVICMVDNCYGEFVEEQEPIEVGADIIAGSLIKNPGGGIALTGGYLAGKEYLIEQVALRLTAPGIGLDVGSSLNFNRPAYQGLFVAPHVVGEALKGAILAAKYFELLEYPVLPLYNESRTDIIQAIELQSRKLMVAFCRGIQRACPLDSNVSPEPALLPGYTDEVIMAGGTFIQGSSIELSADGPIRPPYIIYIQGGMSLSHIKTGLIFAAEEIRKIKG
ncbi:MAG: methionine gamma-lyase family protein [Clostridia bacterium]|nr:methionine gamma-lyase family protein [Clostridia bacterium]MDD4047302.1 methionine gamma-lyase family protein [Clostridia bacterium]